jgi:hypothetical protein
MTKILVIALLTLLTSNASAAVITLDFEGVASNAAIGNFYNGGAGVDYGVQFGSTAVGIIDSDAGAGNTANIANEPSPSTALVFTTFGGVSNPYLTVAAGFDTGVSFFYTSLNAVFIHVYDGIDGTGNQIGSLALNAQHNGNGCVGDPNGSFCNWSQVGLSFTGTAKSIGFGEALNFTAFDNITLGANLTAVPPTPVPEPETYLMLLLGLGLIRLVVPNKKMV